jgi:hypothetical protein
MPFAETGGRRQADRVRLLGPTNSLTQISLIYRTKPSLPSPLLHAGKGSRQSKVTGIHEPVVPHHFNPGQQVVALV